MVLNARLPHRAHVDAFNLGLSASEGQESVGILMAVVLPLPLLGRGKPKFRPSEPES